MFLSLRIRQKPINTSILHIGVSNFHRSHQAYYIHEPIDKYKELDYGICGVDLLDSDRKTIIF
jgi:mannitol 2-dehydrogenase